MHAFHSVHLQEAFPFVEGFINVEANNISDLKEKLDDSVCAVMLEYVQGEGGVIALDKDFVDAVYELCSEKDILVIADEVQTGIGRTGKLLAGEHYGKRANITTLAKGLAGGLPIGACLADEKCDSVLTAGTHGSTFGGNPVCCAGGKAVLETVLADGFLESVAEKAEIFRTELGKMSEIESVSGLGMMIGCKLKTKQAADVVKAALDEGLLLLTAKEKVRLLPPLTISEKEMTEGINIIRKLLEV